ncbi:hypothetical protein HK098_004057 [Nowakowskiella sp. JEL0407]|nr:hypothetical protein HK098_004057 [Nowakowskiella sp. JEL0407]
MARFGKKKKEQFNNRKKKDEQHVSGVRQDYDLAKKENDAFVAYYKAQNILPTDEEFDIFLQKLKDPLPTSFRFTGSRLNTAELRDNMIKSYFPDLQNLTIEVEGVPTQIPLPEPIPWYPNRAGWQWQTSKRELKKNSALTRFHQFLHAETEMGNISRQEAVSMIPCLFLDVEPHHAVLDMCAAPGSKTAQLIEAVQNDEHVIPSGFVIANDSDYSRAQMLVKQTKRLQSPCIVVTNHEAQSFPNIYMNPRSHPERCALQFDRILCDVPCSGDGTFRKNKGIPLIRSTSSLSLNAVYCRLSGIWKTWHHNHANALHKLQVMIIMRAAELLKVGGRLVYSTCSFNPVENEAVVAEAMRQSGGALRIFDVSDRLPELQRREGLVNWKVHSKSKVLYDRWEDVIESDAVGEKKIRESMFIKDGEGEAFGLRRWFVY